MFETDKVFTIKTLNMCESIGYFCIIRTDSSNALYWDSCREIFAKNFNYNSYGFYYVVDIKKVDYILSFLIEAEKILKVERALLTGRQWLIFGLHFFCYTILRSWAYIYKALLKKHIRAFGNNLPMPVKSR